MSNSKAEGGDDVMCELFQNVILSIITGVVSGFFVSWVYERRTKKEAIINQFKDDKQAYSKYLGVVANEIEIYREQKGSTDNLKRVLVEPHWYNSFKEEQISKESGTILTEAFAALQALEKYIDERDSNDIKLMLCRSNIVKSQINILKLKLKK